MNKKNLREMAKFLIKIDYRKSPFYETLPEMPSRERTSGYALEQYFWVWSEKLPITDVLGFLGIETLDVWQWCFDLRWEKLARTKGEATLAERETGQRILWLLDFGLPKNWDDQMRGKIRCHSRGYYGLKDFEGKAIIKAEEYFDMSKEEVKEELIANEKNIQPKTG